MENLDERHVSAARYLKVIRTVADGRVEHADAIRMAIFVLYLDLVGKQDHALTRVDSRDRLNVQADALTRAYTEARSAHGLRNDARVDFQVLGDDGLARLLHEAPLTEEREDKVRQFDYLVDALLGEQFKDAATLRIEKFVAHFARPFVDKGAVLLDLGRNSSGELGTQVAQAASLWLPNLIHGAEFEVLLKLEVHGCQVRRSSFERNMGLRQSGFCLLLPPRKDTLVAELDQAVRNDSPGNSGLAMASWFARHAKPGQVAVTLLSLRDCRDKGIRGEIRRDLVGTGSVRAVIELPRRVAIENRQFMLVLRGPEPELEGQEVLFVDGRSCDVLRDEPLDRIAAFTSVPLLARSVGELERIWPDWRNALGSELALRASKMLLGGQREARGLHRTVPVSELFDTEPPSLEPAAWIQPLDSGNALAMLDPTPLRALLDSPRPCCAYVIGDNGVGKSFLLRGLVDHYLQAGRAVRALSSSVSDRFPTASKAFPNYRYLGARTTATGSSSRLLARQMLGLLQTIHREPHRVAVLDKASELVGFNGRHFILPADRMAAEDSLAALRSIDEVAFLELRNGDRPGFQRSESTVIVPFDHLSTGEQQMLLLLARLVAEAIPGALFIVDEPEASLHVAWQRALPGVLNVLRDSFQVQFSIATHSPVLLSAALGSGNHRFAARGGLVEALPNRASSVERILFDGFGTYTESNREVHERCAEIVSTAIERVNLGERDVVEIAMGELAEMRHTVERSIPALGVGRTEDHLRLIERARLVLEGLEEERAAAEVAG